MHDDSRGQAVLPVGDLPSHGTIPGAASIDLPVPAVALAVAAHPDDAEFGCGATLAKWAAAGCRIHHLVLTDGSKGTWDENEDIAALVQRRHREQRAAAEALGGGGVDFLDYTDGELESGIAPRRQVCEVIRRVRPEVVLGHDPWRRYRLHPDHRNAGWLVTDGIVAARDPHFFPDLVPPAHRPSVLLLWEADAPNHVEDAHGMLETKMEALLAHRSQYRSTMGIAGDDGPAQDDMATFRARVEAQLVAHGALAGLPAGEAFHRLADI